MVTNQNLSFEVRCKAKSCFGAKTTVVGKFVIICLILIDRAGGRPVWENFVVCRCD